jgi:hypothetical protein
VGDRNYHSDDDAVGLRLIGGQVGEQVVHK